MPVKRIVKYGADILNRKTKQVNFSDLKPDLPHILKDMWDSCFALKGTGLAANQIGLDLRLAVIVMGEKEQQKKYVLINPKIVEKGGQMCQPEGCLSLPGICVNVKRYAQVKVKALNQQGIAVEIKAEGLLARALQHEIDHLDGKIFIDRLSAIEKVKLKPVLKKLKPYWLKTDESKGKFYEGPVFGDT
jgi:peptide deformylase